MASVTVGSFGYRRGFGVTSTKVGEGTLLVAGEAGAYNGPWDNPDNLRKLNGVMRYSQGTSTDGFSLTGMAYANKWNSTDQVPARAISSGEIGLYGALDPSDGGNSNRFSLSGNWAQSEADGSSKANFYVIKSSLNLWNNFTYFLSDPVNGDQFHQHDDRVLGGINASHTFLSQLAGLPMETEIGVQSRYDDIRLDLSNTLRRQFLVADPQRRRAGRQRRNFRAEYAALDRLAANRRRLARRFLRHFGASRFSRRPIPAPPMPSSAARNSASCSGRLPRPNSSSMPAKVFTATTRAA